MSESGKRKDENEQGHIDGYDLTEVYPGGLFLRDLRNKNATIAKAITSFSFGSSWGVASVAGFVNDQLLCCDRIERWLLNQATQNTLTATLRLQ